MIYQSEQTGTTQPIDPASRQTDVLGHTLGALYRRLSLHRSLLERWNSTLRIAQTSAMS